MNQARTDKYQKLEERIGNTPIVEFDKQVANNNNIHIKMESDNPFGSHYDRVYLDLFKHYEELGKITPGDKVLETSSGSAGVSFAGLGKQLGYHCITAMPAGGEKAREQAILNHLQNPSDLILTPADEYVNGFEKFLKQYLPQNKNVFFLNHSMGPRDKQTGQFTENYVTTNALSNIATEALKQTPIDYFIPAIGNGSSIVGPARIFKEHDVEIIGYETFQSATAFEKKFPGRYEKQYGIKPGTMSRHSLPGTSFKGIDFPHLNIAAKESLDDIMLISDSQMDNEYTALTGKKSPKLIHWDEVDFKELGRSSRAGLAAALKQAQAVKDKHFLVIGYDTKKRYDS